jgi:hypothetical protein
VPEVLPQRVDSSADTDPLDIPPDGYDASHFRHGGAACLDRIHTAADISLGERFQMRAKLLVHFRVELPASEKRLE